MWRGYCYLLVKDHRGNVVFGTIVSETKLLSSVFVLKCGRLADFGVLSESSQNPVLRRSAKGILPRF